ncbi:alpha/beta fold hydrolase [Pseudalkalibacillus salsuginis]|uniref:alpha/beta fold hydrolase n=1 Tax=Pseudalkalibacillus salsuginis TaxID=2910972 RepID=UPI001F2E166B|nr:alpha/beta hydrolase [Pseudalkalibacillus salsuginis]MCF6409904.1 alpha/beta hydrolase [Pseudalkalibacillus salsuginis]
MLEYKLFKKSGGEHVVLIHGIGGNSNIFYKQLKDYRKRYNVVTIHLPGHGGSPDVHDYKDELTFDLIAREIFKVMDHLHIKKAHFVGVSLGAIIIHHLMKVNPKRISSAVLAGAITRFNFTSKLLIITGRLVKGFIPHMWLYVLFARILMPHRNHKQSRLVFINEAKKMTRKNLLSYFYLYDKVPHSYQFVQQIAKEVPKLYISGEEDYFFISFLRKDISGDLNAKLTVIDRCGHVCNIEKPKEFNALSLEFLDENMDKAASL